MKTNVLQYASQTGRVGDRRSSGAGFTLAEALIATAVVGISFISLYSGLVQGDKIIGASQQNLRATQIMQQQAETLRLYTWDQLTNNGYIPTSSTYFFYPATMTNQTVGTGTTFYESLMIANSGLTEGYNNDLRQAIITVTWTSDSGTHTRQMTTMISHYGMQNYIYK